MIIENVIISKNSKKFRGGVLQVKKTEKATPNETVILSGDQLEPFC